MESEVKEQRSNNSNQYKIVALTNIIINANFLDITCGTTI